jgi:DNA-binding FadR family transcriptional regulator
MADRIVVDVLTAIGTGRLGERSPVPAESTLAAQYGVSRSVVREAVRTLAAKGFVIASQGSSTLVAPRVNWNVLDPEFLSVNSGEDFFENLQQARELFEPGVTALAASGITDEQLRHLEELHGTFETPLTADEHARIDIQFHEAIAAASGNPVIVALLSLISGLGLRTRVRSAELTGAVARAQLWHRKILDALRAKDAKAAEDAMRQHLRQVRGELDLLGYTDTNG